MSASLFPISAGFSGRSSRQIPGVYEIDFKKSEQLIKTLTGDTSLVASYFRSAIYGDLSKRRYAPESNCTIMALHKTLEEMRTLSAGQEADFKIIEVSFQSSIDCLSKQAELTLQQIEKNLTFEGGKDVVAIKEMLNCIYGLTKKHPSGIELLSEAKKVSPLSLEEREKYHQILVKVGFVKSSFPNVEAVVYRPGKILHDILRDDSKANTLLMGCGKRAAKFDLDVCNNPDSPSWGPSASRCKKEQIIAEHNDRAITLDIDSAIDPHVLVNMMDLEMLREIPDCRIKKISDHSNGFLSLYAEDEEEKNKKQKAFIEYHRILKPKGRIELIGSISDEDAKVYEKIGFIVEKDKGVLIKPEPPTFSILERELIE